MTTFEKLDDVLLKCTNWDYWGDSEIEYASELIEQLSEDEWRSLERVYRSRPIDWQSRLLEILHVVESPISAKMFVDMLSIDDAWFIQRIISRLLEFPIQLIVQYRSSIDFGLLRGRLELGVTHLKQLKDSLNELKKLEERLNKRSSPG